MLIVLTPGDPDGIGPEITWKALKKGRFDNAKILCIGARKPFEKLKAPIVEASIGASGEVILPKPGRKPFIWLLPAPTESTAFLPGYQAGWSIEKATGLVRSGQASALVTGPINKERLQKGGFPYSGHTDFLAALCETRHVTMMLANEKLRVSLVTTHLALKDVPAAVTRESLRRAVTQTVGHLRKWWGIRRPRVAIAALNPHAGEAGLFGREEIETMIPEIESLRSVAGKEHVLIGPLPADTLFAKHALAKPKERYDAVVCMYHDQGLIPVKQLDFPNTVNVTLGLPIVRTSVDHGTGFDIAGKGIADPSSLQAAIRLAIRIVNQRVK